MRTSLVLLTIIVGVLVEERPMGYTFQCVYRLPNGQHVTQMAPDGQRCPDTIRVRQ